ncbi:MAG TPA: iron ABC transporter substrate-binding protein, partial [Opitutus sp.]|nr:iron ABC transporter substrate-binding protein [Opitutus sp.]
LPVRRDYYEQEEWNAYRSDPEVDPFEETERLVYRPAWTGGVFREMAFIIRVMTLDTHAELERAWRAINAAEDARRERALAVLQDMSAVDYELAKTDIKRALSSKNKVDEITLGRELGSRFRAQYARAERVARGEE